LAAVPVGKMTKVDGVVVCAREPGCVGVEGSVGQYIAGRQIDVLALLDFRSVGAAATRTSNASVQSANGDLSNQRLRLLS